MGDIVISRDSRNTVLYLVLLLSGIALLFLFVWYARELFLVLFAGILLALILRSFAGLIQRTSGLRPRPAYAAAIAIILLTIGLLGWALVPGIVRQVNQLFTIFPNALRQIEASLSRYRWGPSVVRFSRNALHQMGATMNTPSLISAVSDALIILIAILVVGFYGALNPALYLNGLLRLVPPKNRPRTREVGLEVIETLRWWLLGQLVPMTILGAASILYLWILKVPLALTLGLLTGVMIFIPYVGSFIAGVPAALIAFERGPTTMILVIGFYIFTHLAEGYFLTPMVQKKAVRLPPILTLAAELLMWLFAGLLGVALATPLAAAGLTLVKNLYLHEEVDHWQ